MARVNSIEEQGQLGVQAEHGRLAPVIGECRPSLARATRRTGTRYAAWSAAILILLLGGLISYKAVGSLHVLQNAASSGGIGSRHLLILDSSATGLLERSGRYLALVWPALVFGILISAAVRTFVSPNALASLLGHRRLRAQLIAGAAGAPLMLCSCCVAPIFASVYERTRQLGPSLGVMLAAPSLNPAAIALTFMFFAPRIAWTRVVLALAAVFIGSALVAKFVRVPPAAVPSLASSGNEDAPLVPKFLRSCIHVTVRTVPFIVLGLVTALAIADRFPLQNATTSTVSAVAFVALIATPLALPTFFEVPLALALLGAGVPSGAAISVLFAGPAVNLASLLTIGHASSWKVSLVTATLVWTLAVVGGLIAG